MRHEPTLRSSVAFALALLAGHPPAARAVEPLAVLPDHHPAAAAEIAAEGDAAGTAPLHVDVFLAPRNSAKLDALLRAQQDPSSPLYHRWLSAPEYERRFGPTAADVAEVASWLAASGFHVVATDPAQGRVTVDGDVATARSAFRIRVAGSSDGEWFGNVDDPVVPARLAPKIRYIAGLHDLSASTFHTTIADPNNNNGLTSPHFGPPDVWTYYDEKSLLDAGTDGRGQCIAALEGSDVDQASLDDFDGVFGLPALVAGQNFDTVLPDGPIGVEPPIPNQGARAYSEAILDIDYAHGLAPGAQIVLYAGNVSGLGTQGLVDTLKAATTDNLCGTITISWAQCGEPKSFFKMLDDSYRRGAAQGQSIFVATGDVGVAAPTNFSRRSRGCEVPTKKNIEENAGSPNVTAVGATEIQPPQYDGAGLDAGIGMPAEQVWSVDIVNHLIKSASTGGVSAIFRKPKFQKGIKGFARRGVPDVAFAGGATSNPGFWECFDFGLFQSGTATHPTCTVGGGTSVSAPEWSAVAALLQQKKGGRLGNIDTQLYAMAKANLANPAAVGIRDVTTGNNGYYPLTGYDAKPGFDLASGWGSIDVAQFVDAFTTFQPPHKRH